MKCECGGKGVDCVRTCTRLSPRKDACAANQHHHPCSTTAFPPSPGVSPPHPSPELTPRHATPPAPPPWQARGKELVPLLADGNLVDAAWGDAQPELPLSPLRVHALQWAGQGVADKLAAMRQKMKGGWRRSCVWGPM
jgi:hypothetical protein